MNLYFPKVALSELSQVSAKAEPTRYALEFLSTPQEDVKPKEEGSCRWVWLIVLGLSLGVAAAAAGAGGGGEGFPHSALGMFPLGGKIGGES